jgi:hypothetical protein
LANFSEHENKASHHLAFAISIYEAKVVCFVLFCFSHSNLPNHHLSCHTLGIFEKLLMGKGAPTWFETTIWSYGVKIIDY